MTDPECLYGESFCGDTGCPTHGIEEPAAPESSGDDYVSGVVQTLVPESRALSAEAQIAAVRAACLTVCPDGHGSVHISTAVLWPLLGPAPSPVAGENT